jgi:hypothetical protein
MCFRALGSRREDPRSRIWIPIPGACSWLRAADRRHASETPDRRPSRALDDVSSVGRTSPSDGQRQRYWSGGDLRNKTSSGLPASVRLLRVTIERQPVAPDSKGRQMRNNHRRVTLTLGAVVGGLLAAGFLPMAVAFADQYDFTPDITTFVPTQVEGYPPLINEVTGTEDWSLSDATTSTVKIPDAFLLGTDTETTIGSFTNNDFLTANTDLTFNSTTSAPDVAIPGDSQIDIADFGGGFENEWVDVAGSGSPDSGISDLLITPFGDFPLLGSLFADLAAAIG